MAEGFVTVISCIDGRVQQPLGAWARTAYGAEHADMVTRPGCDQVLSDGAPESEAEVRRDVDVSVRAHAPAAIVVSGHHDCAANPTTQRHHVDQIARAVERVRGWGGDVPVVGVWVDESWQVHRVAGDEPPHAA